MLHLGGPRCPPALVVLLCLVAGGRGSPECWERVVSAGGELLLMLEKPQHEWVEVAWKVKLNVGNQKQIRILTADKDGSVDPVRNTFFGRATFNHTTLSLRISPINAADSGVYWAETESSTGYVPTVKFCVSAWEPVRSPLLEARVLHVEQGWCNLSLLCNVSGTSNVSYNWSCTGRLWGHQPLLNLQVHRDAESTICSCNVSNPVSWDTASTDVTAACRGADLEHSSIVPWWAVAVIMGLVLTISVVLVVTCCGWRKRRRDPSGGHAEEMLTVYEEVGKAQTGQAPNQSCVATVEGNTVYAVICPRTQTLSRPLEPESCTIYSKIQPTRKSPSLRRKKLDRSLVSTAYLEDSPPVLPYHHVS